MLGAVYGDVIGSYYEVHQTKNMDFPLQRDSMFTDDSVLVAAVCRTILDEPDPVGRFGAGARAKAYAARYRQYYARYPHAGFGTMFAAWAKDPGARRGHSYANGAAMRASPIGWAYDDWDQVLRQAKASALPTHDCREAIRGAQAVAAAVLLARSGAGKAQIAARLEKLTGYALDRPLSAVREGHVFDSRTAYSVPPAIIAFLASTDHESAVRGAVSLGGDADTQACIAGAIAEAFYREIPAHIRRFCDGRIDSSIRMVMRAFAHKFGQG